MHWSAIPLLFILAAQSPRQEGTRPLTTDELRRSLPGATVAEVVPHELRHMTVPEQFNGDGTYIRHADNVEIEGHYVIEEGKFCVLLEKGKYCRFLLLDHKGRYWISKSLDPSHFQLVEIDYYGR